MGFYILNDEASRKKTTADLETRGYIEKHLEWVYITT